MRLGNIDGVVIQSLARHADDRGYFEELIRVTDGFFQEGFGQLSHSKMYPGVVKAWHIHKTQVDWWYVAFGRLRVGLHDLREGSPTRGVTQEVALGDDLRHRGRDDRAVDRGEPDREHQCADDRAAVVGFGRRNLFDGELCHARGSS